MPGAMFWANLTRLDDEALPPVGAVGQGGIVNGLYSIHIRASTASMPACPASCC